MFTLQTTTEIEILLQVLVTPDPPIILNGAMINTTEETEISLECFSSGGRPEVTIT